MRVFCVFEAHLAPYAGVRDPRDGFVADAAVVGVPPGRCRDPVVPARRVTVKTHGHAGQGTSKTRQNRSERIQARPLKGLVRIPPLTPVDARSW